MTHRQAFTVALFLAAIATGTGTGTAKATKHGALRISIGAYRIHADTDEVTVWRAGGPAILWTVAAPVAVALPPVAVAPVAAPQRRYRVPAYSRPAVVLCIGVTA
jgi:hypothetical protein